MGNDHDRLCLVKTWNVFVWKVKAIYLSLMSFISGSMCHTKVKAIYLTLISFFGGSTGYAEGYCIQ